MVYIYGKDELVDKSSCAVQRADLKMCLLLSDCVKKKKKTPRQCLIEPEGMVPDDCFALRTAFFECKRSLVEEVPKEYKFNSQVQVSSFNIFSPMHHTTVGEGLKITEKLPSCVPQKFM